jgi:hypothetical protein
MMLHGLHTQARDRARRAIAGRERRLSDRQRALLVFASALALYIATAGGSLSSSDAVVSFNLTESLVERHSIALSASLLGLDANRGVDGRYYSQFGIGHSIYNIPFYIAGRSAARLLPRPIGNPATLPKAAVALGSAVAAAAAVACVWLLAVWLTDDQRASLVAAASAAIASPLWPYSKFGFSTALTAALLIGAACCCWKSARDRSIAAAALGGALIGWGWLTRHEMALLVLPFSLFLWLDGRRRGTSRLNTGWQVAAFTIATALGGLMWMAYNAVRFGSPLAVGYVPSFSGIGYAAYLLSPGGSVLVFCPIAVLWLVSIIKVRSAVPALALLLASPLAISYVFYGALTDWPGGRSYGPRYLVPALVMMAPALAAALRRGVIGRRTAVIAVAIAAVQQLPGVLVDYSKVSVDWARQATHDDIVGRNWRLASSPLVLNGRRSVPAVVENVRLVTGRRPIPSAPGPSGPDDREFAQRLSFSLDFWWLYLVYLGVLRPASGLAIAGALASVAAVSAYVLWVDVSREASPASS